MDPGLFARRAAVKCACKPLRSYIFDSLIFFACFLSVKRNGNLNDTSLIKQTSPLEEEAIVVRMAGVQHM